MKKTATAKNQVLECEGERSIIRETDKKDADKADGTDRNECHQRETPCSLRGQKGRCCEEKTPDSGESCLRKCLLTRKHRDSELRTHLKALTNTGKYFANTNPHGALRPLQVR